MMTVELNQAESSVLFCLKAAVLGLPYKDKTGERGPDHGSS